MLKVLAYIVLCFLLIGCADKNLTISTDNNGIEILSEFFYGQNGFSDPLVPKHYRRYLTRQQVKDFSSWVKVFDSNPFKIYHFIYYEWVEDSTFNGRRLKDTAIKSAEAYRCEDATMGMDIRYYPDGKIEFEGDYVILNHKSKETITMEYFNKINYRDTALGTYTGQPNGTWKYYSPDGTLIKEEIYNKGTLVKTVTH